MLLRHEDVTGLNGIFRGYLKPCYGEGGLSLGVCVGQVGFPRRSFNMFTLPFEFELVVELVVEFEFGFEFELQLGHAG